MTGGSSRVGLIIQKASWLLWLAMALCIPFTSSPVIAMFLGDSAAVSPLAMLPALILLLMCVLPYTIRKGHWPYISAPLWLFAVVTLLSGILALSRPIQSEIADRILSSTLVGWGTLALGLSYYLSTVLTLRSPAQIKRAVQVIYLGLVFILVWSTVQATYVLSEGRRVPLVLNNIHHLWSIRDLIYNRVVGWTFEPSWLGNQLLVLYIPLLLGSVLTRFSVFSTRRIWFSAELLLLTWSVAVLGLTQSRISYLSFFFVVSLLVIAFMWRWIGRFIHRRRNKSELFFRIARIGMMGIVVITLVASLAGLLVIISKLDKRMGRLVSLVDQIPEFRALYLDEAIYPVANRLAFAERMIYWETGYHIFEQYPLFGVGLGNNGFYFKDNLPAYGYSLVEIRYVIDPETNSFPNPKNLWVRLLSETGIVGFSVFMVWLLVTGLTAFSLSKRFEGMYAFIGVSGLIAIAAQLVEGFSLDTFALPQFWILPAFIAAARWGKE